MFKALIWQFVKDIKSLWHRSTYEVDNPYEIVEALDKGIGYFEAHLAQLSTIRLGEVTFSRLKKHWTVGHLNSDHTLFKNIPIRSDPLIKDSRVIFEGTLIRRTFSGRQTEAMISSESMNIESSVVGGDWSTTISLPEQKQLVTTKQEPKKKSTEGQPGDGCIWDEI